MKRITRIGGLLAAAIVAAAAWPMVQAAHAQPSAPTVPPEIAVPEGNKLFLLGHAVGVQIYSCNATVGGYRWEFVAPRAELYADNGKRIATHFGGPTWRATDGSTVLGTLAGRVTVDPTAIPWLLLSASATGGVDGDRLAETTFVQRTATTGGLAPSAADCDATTPGISVEVPYTADYHFWKATGG